MTTNDIRDQISRGKVKEAIAALSVLATTEGRSDISSEVLLQSGKFKKNERDNRMGIISSDDYLKTRNQITVGILDLLGQMDEPPEEIPITTKPLPVKEPGLENKPSQPGNKRTSILFLSSNPSDTGQMQLVKEHSHISTEIQQSKTPDRFRIIPTKAVTLKEMQKYLITELPDIVHFSGHGQGGGRVDYTNNAGEGMHRDLVPQEGTQLETGIILTDESKRHHFLVKTNVVKELFRFLAKKKPEPITAVIFNSCYSEAQAVAIAEVVPYVIGTSDKVKDEAAIAFATGFYLGIAQGESVSDAYDLGWIQAMAYDEPKERFVLYKDGEKIAP